MPKISFIMPVYNVEKYIDKCLDSIINQTFDDFELIIIDDGSPDGSPDICDNLAARDSRVRVIHKQNGGVSAARNDGIDASTGDWLYFVDSDDWLELDAAERLVQTAEDGDFDCVMSYAEKVFSDGRKIESPTFDSPFSTDDSDEIGRVQKYVLYQRCSEHYTSRTKVGYAAPWGKFVRGSLVRENKVYFDPYLRGVFDDGLWSLHLFDYVKSFAYIHQKTYNYRMVEGSLTHSFKPNAMETQERGYERVEEWLIKTRKDKSYWTAYYAHVVRFFGGYLSRYFFNPNNPKPRNEVRKELDECLSREPYATAAKNVSLELLEAKDMYLAIAERLHALTMLELYVKAKEMMGKE